MKSPRASKQDRFRIWGTIAEKETGRPLPNLIVRGYDKDLLFDDKVGYATTDQHGSFEIRFGSSAFSHLGESDPDLYLRIYDSSGTRVIHETSDAIRWNASRDEQFEIAIPARALLPPGAR